MKASAMSVTRLPNMELLSDALHITEQEMDFLILEELACSPPFAQWFLRQTGYPESHAGSIRRLGRSVSTWDGETDLLIVHSTQSGDRALLIENKVGAAFTELQSERYRVRGKAGQDSGEWKDFATVLIAPRFFLAHTHGSPFDFTVSYEALMDVLVHTDPLRTAFKTRLLSLAISKAKAPWVKTISPEVTAFFKAFRHFAVPRLSDVTWPLEKAPRSPGSAWIQLRVPPFSSRLLIEVKPDSGVVDLRLFGVREGRLRTEFPILPEGADTVSAAKSSAIRLQASRMDLRAPFEGQESLADVHISAVRTLWLFAHENVAILFRLLDDPRTF